VLRDAGAGQRMRAPIETLRQNILSMLAPALTADVGAIAALTEADWIAINRMVKQHRLGPPRSGQIAR
jgi:hypothetical protein